MKYLITGGAGFIGSQMAESLVASGNEIVIFDNFSSGNYDNLKKIKSHVKIEYGDILDAKLVYKLVANSNHVLHLAASLGVFNILNNPLKSLNINLDGTKNILKACNEFGIPALIASSSEVYGKNSKIPLSENDDRIVGNPLTSRWSYSEAKAIDESLAYFYYLENKLPVRIVRFFNTVGPRQVSHHGMVVPRFVEAALKNQPLNVYGSGEQIRCFCHVTDAIRALMLVIDSDKTIGEVFNIGNNQQVTIMELAKKVIELTGSKSEIETIPYENAYPDGFEDMQIRVPDISKIKQVLGWAPEINLDQIIKDVAAFNSN